MAHNSAVAPFSHDGGTTGVCFIHGFTGSPASLLPQAERMAREGYSVRLPLLPGHGTTWQDMSRSSWEDWYGASLAAVQELRQRCDRVFVFGLSMGGALSLRLAQECGGDVAGLILVNPQSRFLSPLTRLAPVLHHVAPSLKAVGNDIKKPGMNEHCYDRLPVRSVVELRKLVRAVTADIARVTQPLLVCTSVEDHLVQPRNSQWVVDNVRSKDVSSLVLEDSFHVATLDNDAERITDAALTFVRRLEG